MMDRKDDRKRKNSEDFLEDPAYTGHSAYGSMNFTAAVTSHLPCYTMLCCSWTGHSYIQAPTMWVSILTRCATQVLSVW